LILGLIASINVVAQSINVDGLSYQITSSSEVKVTDQTGNETSISYTRKHHL